MKKKIATLLLGLMASFSSYAQGYQDDIVFNEGKFYVSGQFSGFDLNYTDYEQLKFNLGIRGGYYVADDFMALVNAQLFTSKDRPTELTLGCGARYNIEQNGLYFGANVNWCHVDDLYNDIRPEINLGYTYFLSRTVAIEPEAYYSQSFVNHRKYSGFGLRIGISVYLE